MRGAASRLFCTIVGILIIDMDGFRARRPRPSHGEQHHSSEACLSQFSWVHLGGFLVDAERTGLLARGNCGSIPLGLQENINNLPVLVNCAPQVVLFSIDLHKDFVNVKGITVALVPALHPPGTGNRLAYWEPNFIHQRRMDS